MRLTEKQLNQIIEEEFINLINEEEIDEKLFDKLKSFGKGLISKLTKPSPKASAGVGRSFARYKVPQKQSSETEPQAVPSTALAVKPSTAISGDVIDQTPEPLTTEPTPVQATVKPRGFLGTTRPSSQQDFKPFGLLPSTPQQRRQLLLSEPTKIGVTDEVGDLLSDTQGEAYRLLFAERTQAFRSSDFFKNLAPQQQNQADTYINTVLKHLISTERVLKNPTYIPMTQNTKQESVPSVRQIEADFDTFVVKLLKQTTKQTLNYIPPIIIDFIIDSLHEEGRLAISKRMYNKLKHTEDPRLKLLKPSNTTQQETSESKSYNNFYNNWKKYIGVKI